MGIVSKFVAMFLRVILLSCLVSSPPLTFANLGVVVYAAQSRGDAVTVGKGVRTRFLEVRSQVVVDEMLRDERNQILVSAAPMRRNLCLPYVPPGNSAWTFAIILTLSPTVPYGCL